ncbi:hypothetical protein L1887_50204 [Cichorium endivia]|nr:hypothetical protein L1887_50204 [Cichorium endivia]
MQGPTLAKHKVALVAKPTSPPATFSPPPPYTYRLTTPSTGKYRHPAGLGAKLFVSAFPSTHPHTLTLAVHALSSPRSHARRVELRLACNGDQRVCSPSGTEAVWRTKQAQPFSPLASVSARTQALALGASAERHGLLVASTEIGPGQDPVICSSRSVLCMLAAVQALARCNEVLERRIVFRDASRRAAGDIPTGSGSTADNFGLIQPLGMRGMDPLTPPIDGSAAFGGTDAYGNVVPMPMHAAAMGGVASPLPKTAAWQHFRTPRAGAEAWEFDSPASVSTNLSEASLDSTGRQLLGYSPYGVSSSIEASPRSGLGSSVDLGTLRIDTGSYAGLAPPAIAVEGSMEGGQRTSFDWDNRMAYGLPPMHAGPSYVGECGMVGQSAPAPAPALDASFALDALGPFPSSHPGSQEYAAPAERSETSAHDLRRDSEPTALRAGRLAAFDEDAFCGQTPTQRTSFDRDHDAEGASDDEAAAGRARSNTFRPNMARTAPPAEHTSHESSDLDADGEAA